jgi:hypothetical protein
MRRIAFSVVAAVSLWARLAAAQPYPPPPPGGPPVQMTLDHDRLKALRGMVGFTGVTNGYYCAYGYVLVGCSSYYQYEAGVFTFGGEFEFGGRALGLAIGAYDMNAPYNDINRNFLEPILDLVLRAGTYNGGPMLRIRFGTGLYIGEGGKYGWVGRGGLGLTLRGAGPWGFAMEAVWEGGTFEGRAVSTIRGLVGPEIAF